MSRVVLIYEERDRFDDKIRVEFCDWAHLDPRYDIKIGDLEDVTLAPAQAFEAVLGILKDMYQRGLLEEGHLQELRDLTSG